MEETLIFGQMQPVVAPVELGKRSVLVAEQTIGPEVAVLDAIFPEIEEVATVLLLVLVTVAGHAVVSELLLPVGERARVSPALGRGDPVEAQLIAFLQAIAILVVVFRVGLDASRIAAVLHVVVDDLRSGLLHGLSVLRAAVLLCGGLVGAAGR